MATYNRTFTHEEKENKLKKFNSVYYNGDAKNWKISRLPNWMEFYGNSLKKELDNKLPKYYRKFKQGTIVMVDYGVTIGNEMAGMHLAVVLSSNDNKYHKNIITVPLSSKYHKGYVDLGYEPLLGAQELFKHKKNNYFNSKELAVIIQKDKNFIAAIKKINSWMTFPDLFKLVSYTDTLIEIADSLINLEVEIKNAEKLRDEIYKYSNRSYVNVSEIRSISKLRVSKFSYLSGNISISKDSLALIKSKLLDTI